MILIFPAPLGHTPLWKALEQGIPTASKHTHSNRHHFQNMLHRHTKNNSEWHRHPETPPLFKEVPTA